MGDKAVEGIGGITFRFYEEEGDDMEKVDQALERLKSVDEVVDERIFEIYMPNNESKLYHVLNATVDIYVQKDLTNFPQHIEIRVFSRNPTYREDAIITLENITGLDLNGLEMEVR